MSMQSADPNPGSDKRGPQRIESLFSPPLWRGIPTSTELSYMISGVKRFSEARSESFSFVL